MKKPVAVIGIAIAALSVGVGLVGCGSDSKSKSTTTSTASATSATATKTSVSSSAPSTSTQAWGPNKNINDFIKENNIQETAVKEGDPASPANLPVPQGWTKAAAPGDYYWAIQFDSPADPNDPPTVSAQMAKLTGNVDQAKLFAVAHGDAKNLAGFSETDPAQDSTLGGFPATQIGGTYTEDGKKRAVYEKTVLITGSKGTFILQLVAESAETERAQLQEAMSAIDQGTTITP